jgi:hypothetical protein
MKKTDIITKIIKNGFDHEKIKNVKAPLLKRAWEIEEKSSKDEKIIIQEIFNNIFTNEKKYEKIKIEKKKEKKAKIINAESNKKDEEIIRKLIDETAEKLDIKDEKKSPEIVRMRKPKIEKIRIEEQKKIDDGLDEVLDS